MPAIELHTVGKRYRQTEGQDMLLKKLLTLHKRKPPREVWALRDIDLTIERGETVGVIGRNGSGKTTMLRLLAGVSAPTVGRLRVEGSVAPLIGVGVGFNPELTGRENVYANGQILGMTASQVRERFDEIVAFSEVESFLDVPVKFYSSGMFLRLAFAVAIHVDPEVLLVDEVLAVGDIAFQLKCFERMQQLRDRGTTIVVVTHNLHSLGTLCNRAIVLSHGEAVFDGPVDDGIAAFHRVLHTEARDHADVGARNLELGGPKQVEMRGGAIVTAEVVDADGSSTGRVTAGSKVEVHVHAEFDAPVKDPVLGYLVGSGLFGNLYMTNTLPGEYAGQHDREHPLDAVLRLETPLLEGDFRVMFVVLDAEGKTVLGQTGWEQFYVSTTVRATGLIDLDASLQIGDQVLRPGERLRLTTDAPAGG